MKNLSLAGLVGAILLLSAFTINSINYEVADGYAIEFNGTEAEGVFKKLNGDIVFNETDLSSSNFSMTIEVASINTGNGMKNKHAVSDKWFDAETYPTITFDSNNFSKTESGYVVTGSLEIHGVKKEISIPFTFESNTFNGAFSVNRLDYGIGTMKGMSKKVSDEININISLPVTTK